VVTPGSGEISQTLDRGLTVLALLARHGDGLTVAEIAEQIGAARAIVYRLLRTLEAHDLAGRAGSRYVLGFGVAELASHLRPRLQSVVFPILKRLSQQTGSTALLSVADGDQALILLTAEPLDGTMHLALREGARHPLTVGADGVAILAGRPPGGTDTPDVRLARERGYAVSAGALQEGAVGVAAPIQVSDWTTASIGVVQLGVSVSGADVPEAVTAAAAEAAKLLSAQQGHTAVSGG
jgi:DNA-binding IclR family transcriptional regulator